MKASLFLPTKVCMVLLLNPMNFFTSGFYTSLNYSLIRWSSDSVLLVIQFCTELFSFVDVTELHCGYNNVIEFKYSSLFELKGKFQSYVQFFKSE